MRDTDYAFCVARIRANEKRLLDKKIISKLVESDSYDSALSLLVDAGWIEAGTENENFIKKQSVGLWRLLSDSIPDKSALEGLCILNDYFNIKTAIKCIIGGENAELYYMEPSTLQLDKLCRSIDSRAYDVLKNERMKKAAISAFETACMTNNGQSAEIIVDVAALEALLEIAEKSKYKTFSKICGFTVDASNIRTAIRCSIIGKNYDFIASAVSDCSKISKDRLVKEASAGCDSLRNYLSAGVYSEGTELYYINPAFYDKWFDAQLLEIATQSGFTSFGFDPVCAYFYKKTNEIKTVKLILSAKKSGVPVEVLRERVKTDYA